MQKSSRWLIFIYSLVGVLIISSLLYSFDFTLKDLSKNKSSSLIKSSSTAQIDSPNVYEIKINQNKTIRGIIYTFNNVINDDRCEEGSRCVREGNATIELQVGGLGTSEIIHVSTDATTTYADLNIRLIELTPKPTTSDNKETKARLEITSNENP